MKILEVFPTRIVQSRLSCERVVTVFARLVLSMVYLLIGVSAATVATEPTVSLPGYAGSIFALGAKGRYITYALDSPVLACGGVCPGLCPCPSASKDGDTLDI
jgi:hypothetical protein